MYIKIYYKMQAKSLQHKTRRLGGLPIVDSFLKDLELEQILTEHLGHDSYVQAILLLVKNVLIEREALYAIPEWAAKYAPERVCGGKIKDHTLARALDRLFAADRASLLTQVVLRAVKHFKVSVDKIHNDSTSLKLFGAYDNQNAKAVGLKNGHSKDHRPDLKQLVYGLCVSGDEAIPVHFKTYDGNRTDDTTHWETWQALRGIFSRSDFLYVADSKLCTRENLMNIDKSQGRFITIMPRTRTEMKSFAEKAHQSLVRWEKIYSKRSTRKHHRIDTYELAEGLFQMSEGFRIHWYRSSEKVRRDLENREERIELALSKLKALTDPARKGPRTEKALQRNADKILTRLKVSEFVTTEITLEQVTEFKQKTRGPATESTDFRRTLKWVPSLNCRRNLENIEKAAAMDGIFPLVTNTQLKAVEVLQNYKYQPRIEKRHRLLKSGLHVAPVFLKKNDRIDALMVVYFLAQLVSSLIERQLRQQMAANNIASIALLPEERPSKHPTTEQLFRVFEHRSRYELYSGRIHIKTFVDPMTPIQKQVLNLLNITVSQYS